MPSELVLVCESIHAVLALERALLAAGVACDLVPAPRQLSSDCGMVVMIREIDPGAAEPTLRRFGSRILGRYRHVADGYVALPSPTSEEGG